MFAAILSEWDYDVSVFHFKDGMDSERHECKLQV